MQCAYTFQSLLIRTTLVNSFYSVTKFNDLGDLLYVLPFIRYNEY